MCAVFLYPIVASVLLSMQDIQVTSEGVQYLWVGTKNWQSIFADKSMPQVAYRTVYFVVTQTLAVLLLSLFFALLLNTKLKGIGFLRSLLLFPWAIPSLVAGLMWLWLFNSQYGLFNLILFKLGIIAGYQHWLGNSSTAMNSVIIAQIWKNIPLPTLIILAALTTVPQDLIDEASVDGANVWQRFVHVTIPLIRTSLLFAIVTIVIMSLKVFDMLYIMTKGYQQTMVIYFLVYTWAFEYVRFGAASALGWLTWMSIFAMSLFYIRYFK